MISFTCDYNDGAHPLILQRLTETNIIQEPGYGEDSFCESAKEKIRNVCKCPDADIFFLTGGTQTNATVIDSLLRGYEGVVAAETGHIAVHEAGAIEFGGHKVLTVPSVEGKLSPDSLRTLLESFHNDPSKDHMVRPGMVYISYPTEYGTLYSKTDMIEIRSICREYDIPLFVDGARLGYGLASDKADMDIRRFSKLCDVFTIGGTKVGALCGEAVVFPRGNAPKHFFTTVKQHGALLAKGRLLGIQFDTLFTNRLYFRLGRHAVESAMILKNIFHRKGIPMLLESPTNQQFPILTARQAAILETHVRFERWETLPDGRVLTRFCTSWATPEAHLLELESLLQNI